jgi:hypothetical protein
MNSERLHDESILVHYGEHTTYRIRREGIQYVCGCGYI